MTEAVSLGTKLSGILGNKDLPPGYEDILNSALQNTSTNDNDADISADELTEEQIQAIIQDLNEYAKNEDTSATDQETIYQITQVLAEEIYSNNTADKTTKTTDDYAEEIYDATTITKDTELGGWLEGLKKEGDYSQDELLPTLTTGDQIKVLEYYVQNVKYEQINVMMELLSPTQKAHIFAELETESPFLTFANSSDRSPEFQKNKSEALTAALPTGENPTEADYETFNKIFNNLGNVDQRRAVIDELYNSNNDYQDNDNKMALALMNAAYADDTGTNTHSVSDIDVVMTALGEKGLLANLIDDDVDDTATYYFDTAKQESGGYGHEDYITKVSQQKSDLVNLLQAHNFAGSDDIEITADDVPHLKAFTDLLGTLPITADGATEQTDPVDSITDHLENNPNKEDIFDAIANGDLIINNDDMEYFWNYLREMDSSEQTDFLTRIEPYSPVHLSLIQTLKDHNADIDDTDDLSSGEEKYWESLQALSDAIGTGEGDLSDVDLDYIFPDDDDDDIATSDVIDAIFGNVSDTTDSEANSLHLSDFMVKINKGEFETSDIDDFITTIPEGDISEFSGALLSDESPILSIIQADDDEETLKQVFDNLFSVLSSSNITHQQRMEFLKGINPDSEFFSYLESMGYVQITDIIEELYDEDEDEDEEDDDDDDTDSTDTEESTSDYSEYDDDMILDFFENDISKVTKVWYGSSVSTDYIDDLTSATDEKEMSDILEKAEDAGVLESVLYSISADSFEDGSTDFYNIFFKTLDKNNDYADIFMNSISPNSNLGRTFVSLSDNETPPFDKISYDVDSDTGNIDFGGSESKILKILSDSDLVGASVFYDTFSTIQSEYEDAVGTDNSGIRKLQDEAAKKNLNNDVFNDIFNITSDEEGKLDTDNAEEMLEIIADDESILFKTLGEAELSHFIDTFLSWLASQDEALQEAFCDNLSEDSLFYKAMIKGGADADDFEDGAYQDFINGVSNSDDTAKFIKDYNRFNQSGVVGLGFVPEMLKGTKGSDIDDAVDDIIAYATADGQAMDDLIIDIATGGGVLATLETEQAKTLTEEIFAYILSVKPEEDEDISETALLFLDNIAAGSPIYTLIQEEYPAIAGYLGASVADDDTEYDDKDIVLEMKKLLNNKQLINNYISQSTGTNEMSGVDDTLYLPDEETALTADSIDETDTTDDAQTRTNDTENTGVFASDDMDSATDAALKAMSSRFEVSGEPDFETNTLSSFFFEAHSVKDLADAAYNDNYDTKQVIGTLQLIPLDKQPDFIREYMANGNIDEDTQSFLLGRLLTMTVNNEVGERTVKSILEDAGINELSYDGVVDIMDNWSDVMSQHTDVSITMIDDTYEQVLQASEKLKSSDKETVSGNPNNPNNPNMPNGQYPYGMGGMYGGMPYGMGGMGMPLGMGSMMGGMGMGMPLGMGSMMGGMGSMGMMGMYGMGGMGGANPMMMAQAYNAGVMAGVQMAQGGMNTTAMMQPQMAQTNMAQTQMMQPKDNIVINATGASEGNVNLNITPDGSVNIQKTSTPPIAQTTQAPQQANVSKFTPKNPQ